MTFNGHFGGDGSGYLASTGDEGNVVHKMYLNAQLETSGGAGWFRLVEFLEDGQTVRVRTYSPFMDLERTSSDHAIEFQISPLPPPDLIAGDYNADGSVDAADFTVWRKMMGTSILIADGNGDGQPTAHDWAVWKHHFGETNVGGSGGKTFELVPDPSAPIMLVIGAGLMSSPHRRSRQDST